MSPWLALVLGFPGGLELLLVIFVFFVLFGVPTALLVLLGYKHIRGSAEAESAADERLSTLESEVEELRAKLEADEE